MNEQNFALIRQDSKAVLRPIPIPKLQDDYILVRTVAIALNPTDWTSLEAVGNDGTIVGCDYTGVVEEIGPAVTKSFKKGDRVAGFGHGANDANPETGAFAKFIAVKGDLQMLVPDNVASEAAAAAGVGIASVGYGLYKCLGLPWPDSQLPSSGKTILIYGGSTASGTLAIQLAKLSGLHVVTTCSPKHFELVKSLGASKVYDYRAPGVGKQIHDESNGEIGLVFDTVGIESSAAICAEAIGNTGGLYCNLLEAVCPRKDVQSISFLGYSMSGEAFIFEGESFEAHPEDYAFAKKFIQVAEQLWFDNKWKPHPQRIGQRGFLGAIEGLEEMKQGKVSGEKLVYRVDDTPSA